MKKIIIAGYPKSGNTWLTRLIAELVECPVIGFWKSPKNEIAIEGTERVSDYGCYKSHHQLSEFGDLAQDENTHLIYVIRDPRDIVISGANYFKFYRYPKIVTWLSKFPKGLGIHYYTVYPLFHSKSYRINKMLDTVLFGNVETEYWCRIPWKEHIDPFLTENRFYVKYENMLYSPKEECLRILKNLNINRSSEHIEESIKNQSFEIRKQEFKRKGSRRNIKFLRAGQSGQWKSELTDEQKQRVWNYLGNDLLKLGYEERYYLQMDYGKV